MSAFRTSLLALLNAHFNGDAWRIKECLEDKEQLFQVVQGLLHPAGVATSVELHTVGPALQVVLGLDPVPAARPRVSKWGTYYPEGYKNWKKNAQAFFPQGVAPLEGPLRVELEVVCKRPKKPSSSIPTGDVDNYAKAALDAVNDAALWGDDKQVVSLLVTKRYAAVDETPRTIITIEQLAA